MHYGRRAGSVRRFEDVKLFATRQMPVVEPGQVWADLDPRCEGRTVKVVRVDGGTVSVRTVTPRFGPARTPAATTQETTGRFSHIALSRFRENSRGFALVSAQGPAGEDSLARRIAETLATACSCTLTGLEMRTAAALIALMGAEAADRYVAEVVREPSSVHDLYFENGPGALFADALVWANEEGMYDAWLSDKVA